MYMHVAQVQSFMRNLGLPKGFGVETIKKNRRNGKFDVPYIRIGSTPYFRDSDILKWLEKQTKPEWQHKKTKDG